MLGRIGFVVIAVISAVIGAHSLNPRELYNEMYPVEGLKRDAFHICGDADPTFVRAVGADREACYDSMPHAIAVALGRVQPAGALTMAALIDPSRQAELLMTLAAMPPRQPITAPRSFANTEWARALAQPCPDKGAAPGGRYAALSGLPPSPGSGRAAALDAGTSRNLPALPRVASGGGKGKGLPVIPLVDDKAPAATGRAAGAPAAGPGGDQHGIAAFNPLPAPDVGDAAQPAIVPLAPASACGA